MEGLIISDFLSFILSLFSRTTCGRDLCTILFIISSSLTLLFRYLTQQSLTIHDEVDDEINTKWFIALFKPFHHRFE